ncbi:MAG TPA: NAD-dependent epimerase/dehydratase family protein [Verrucomicrobiae bacterium]
MPSPSKVEINNEIELEQILTCPGAALRNFIGRLTSPLLVLGAGGKMGPTLCALVKRAAREAKHPLEVIAVSRFTNAGSRAWLEARDVKTLQLDLLNSVAVRRLPESGNVLYLVGLKFGTATDPSTTWAVNTIVPARVAERFPDARIVALSTGNVYPLSEVAQGGSLETAAVTPLGEYANSAVARERIFEFYARGNKTRVALLRLFYAVELRYGVLADIAGKVYSGQPIELANGFFNCIWQGDANEMILRALSLTETPASVWNLCRPETFSVREVANRLGDLLGCRPRFEGREASTALLGNSGRLCEKLGPPGVSLETMLEWIAAWVRKGGRSLNKPTHFEVRDGQY